MANKKRKKNNLDYQLKVVSDKKKDPAELQSWLNANRHRVFADRKKKASKEACRGGASKLRRDRFIHHTFTHSFNPFRPNSKQMVV